MNNNTEQKLNDKHAPPPFDKNILQQHRNSADSEFNNKSRKLRPAQKNEKGKLIYLNIINLIIIIIEKGNRQTDSPQPD